MVYSDGWNSLENPIEQQCVSNEIFSVCPEFNRQCEASCDWTKFPETIPNCPHSCGAPKCICKEGFVRLSTDNDTCVPFHFCSDEVVHLFNWYC